MSRVSKLLLLIFVGVANAQTTSPVDYLIPPYQDLSVEFLTDMFGGVSSVLLGPPTIVGILFEVFNIGILVIAMYLLFYTISFNLVNEIGSGQPIAHQYDIWTVSRVIIGNSFLLPSYSGYSLIQVMVMQIAVYGIGLADSVWTAAVNNVSVFGSPTLPPLSQDETLFVNDVLGNGTQSATSSQSLSSNASVDLLWQMTVCAETQYQHAKVLNQDVSRQDYKWKIENNKATVGTTVNGKNCGSVVLSSGDLTDEQLSAAKNGFSNAVIMLQGYAQNLFESALSQDQSLYYDILICAPNGPPSNCQQGPEIAQVASLYYAALKPFAMTTTSTDSDSDKSDSLNALLNQGWAAGSFYILSLTDISDSEPTSTTTIDKNMIESMMFSISSLITYKSNTESIYNDASQLYWILSQCTKEGECGSAPYGLNDNATVSSTWNITKKFYIEPATSIVDASYISSSSSSEFCSGNRYLDVAAATLFLNWFQYSRNDSIFEKMNLSAKSTFFKYSSQADGFDVVYVGFNQRNLYVLLNKILSDITGIKYFSNMDDTAYDDLKHNDDISNDLKSVCSESDVTGCFCAIVSNAEIVTPGRGLMGSFAGNMTSSGQFLTINPMVVLKHMGLDILKHSVDTMVQSISDATKITTQLATQYFNVMLTIQIPFGILATAMSAFPDLGAQNVNNFIQVLRVWFTVFQFLQLLDFQEMELYRGVLSTFTSITPMIGFMLGVYLPLIPAFYYLFAIVGWIISVIEAMIAAPIIALGITYPKGHDLLGNSEQGIILLMQLFARPVSIVFGLMAGLLLSSILFQLFHYMMIGFLAGYASSFSEFGIDKTGTLIGIALIVLSYAYIAIVIVSNSFTLIYRLPDRILRWIGAPIDPTSVGEMVNEVKRGASDAMSKGLRSGAQTRGDMTSTESSRMNLTQADTKHSKK